MVLFLECMLFALIAPGTVLGYVPWIIVRMSGGEVRFQLTPVNIVLILIAISSLSVLVWCVIDFAQTGRGTPAPIDPPRRLVIRGPYRYTRNPMYHCVLTILLCEAIAFRSTSLGAYLIFLALGFHLFIIVVEEPGLRRRFGDEYRQYCQSVPRWGATFFPLQWGKI